MLDDIVQVLTENGIKSTWFVTHASPAIERMRLLPDLIELGIHPNCLPNSSHGTDEAAVLKYVKDIVPDAVSMRTHGLYQTSAFLIRAAQHYGIRIDSSLFLPDARGCCHYDIRVDDTCLRRMPFCWADDTTMRHPSPEWSFAYAAGDSERVRVFDFHPFHVALNTVDYSVYEDLKSQLPLPKWSRSFIAPHRADGEGPRTVFQQMTAAMAGTRTLFLKDLLTDAHRMSQTQVVQT